MTLKTLQGLEASYGKGRGLQFLAHMSVSNCDQSIYVVRRHRSSSVVVRRESPEIPS